MKYEQFIFKRYEFDATTGVAQFWYGYDDALEFCETYTFALPFVDYNHASLDRALQLLFFVAGVSYYKMYLATEIIVQMGEIDEPLAAFLSQTYKRGLGEFFYINKLSPETPVIFPTNSAGLAPVTATPAEGLLVGLGGGKDSLVSIEYLREQPKVATWSLNHRAQLEPLVEHVGLDHFWVSRVWDTQIQTLNAQDAMNGHVPISAVFSCVGLVLSILSGYRDAIVSNESSASEPTLRYEGVAVNHQYSKSLDYETSFQAELIRQFGNSARYFSLLRPFSELRIAELFAAGGFETYREVFSSCNRAFTLEQHSMSWCGECAKCAFVFLILTPFVERSALESLWGGKNLLLNPEKAITYRQLLGIEGDKPFDCVGEVKEARAAMQLAQQLYPKELDQFVFDIPADYDFRAWSDSSMPPELLELLKSVIA